MMALASAYSLCDTSATQQLKRSDKVVNMKRVFRFVTFHHQFCIGKRRATSTPTSLHTAVELAGTAWEQLSMCLSNLVYGILSVHCPCLGHHPESTRAHHPADMTHSEHWHDIS